MATSQTSRVCRTALLRGRGDRFLPGTAPAGLALRAACVQSKACLFLLMVLFLVYASVARAATAPNTAITNTANVAFDVAGTTLTGSSAVTVTTAGVTPATIQFLSYAAGMQSGEHGTALHNVASTSCLQGNALVPMPAPAPAGSGPLPSPGTYPLAPAGAYSAADTAFIQVVDYSANQNATVAEPITITVNSGSGDSERLRLTETGVSTGVFIGYLPLRKGAVTQGNCRLEIGNNEKLVATYVQSGTSAVSTSTALVDPLGLVFDSSTGQPIDGARVTLIDVATGRPAAVFGDDGVSVYPNSVLTGSTLTDSGGTTYVLGAGRYQFPRVNAPGTYRLKIEPPPGYTFPSKITDAAIQQLPGAPFVLSGISRGGQFTVLPGPPVEADVPLDPGPLGSVQITKSSAKAVVGIGDFVPYTVNVSTSALQPLPNLQVLDRLPAGFRYRAGSARLNGTPMAEPQLSPDGRSATFSLGTISPQAPLTLTYVTVAGASVSQGPAQNTARAIGRIESNTASATVLVRDDLNRSRAILAGQVTVAASCEANVHDVKARVPLAGVRILLEDGTYVLTDQDGNWHIDNVLAGTHVVQVDTPTLPQGMPLQACETSTRFGGRTHSQMVTVHGGTLWRADFRYAPAAACLRQSLRRSGDDLHMRLEVPLSHNGLSATLLLPPGAKVDPASVRQNGKAASDVRADDGFVILRAPASPSATVYDVSMRLTQAAPADLRLAVRADVTGTGDTTLAPLTLGGGSASAEDCAALPAGNLGKLRPVASDAAATATAERGPATAAAVTGPALVEVLPYDDKWLAVAKPGNEWLHPADGFQPALPLVKVAVKHDPKQVLELNVNGRAVDPLRFEGTQLNTGGTIALSEWRAVDLREGANALELVVRDATGAVVSRETRSAYYGTGFARVQFEPSRSALVADGRSAPVVAVRFIDSEGKSARRGLTGDFSVEAPYLPRQQVQAIQRDPLSGNAGGRAKFEIGEDGVALVPLEPTTQSGTAVLRFDMGRGRQAEVRVWLEASQREWVLVGFAEGTLGHKVLSGNMQALKDAGAEQLFDNNRVAFYAKGTIQGEYLLTAAYDSARQKGPGAQPLLRQAIDPNAYYTLFGDATQQQYDASSIRNLYLKIEKKQFYLLFGDFNTGLTVTELGRYSRTVNGVKSEYQGETFSYNAFATRTSQGHLRDEVQGDGTSGLYRLRGRDIVPNTDKVRVEIRDRFQPERVLNTRPLAPWIDYEVDHAAGTILLRQPLAARDDNLNPQLLVVEYETNGNGQEAWTYGGRAAMQVTPGLAVGVTRVHEGDQGREGTLTAADASLKVGETVRAKVEVAQSERQIDTGAVSGRAALAEVVHDDGRTMARAYAREQQGDFGVGQQSGLGQGQRRVGVEARSKLSEALQVQGEVSRAQELATGASRDLAEGRAQWQAAEHLKLQAGARVVDESTPAASATTRQAIGGATYDTMEGRLQLRATAEINVGSHAGEAASGLSAYPNRLLFGADYRLSPGVTLTGQHEIAETGGTRLATTSVGLRAQPWTDGELKGSLGQQSTDDAGRLYASLGLVQRWKLSEQWSVDGGVERSHTLRGHVTADPLRLNPLPASGTVPATSPLASIPSGSVPASGVGLVTEDYTAVTAGVAYRDGDWNGNARAEWRTSAIDTKVNLLLAATRKLSEGRTIAAGLQVTNQRGGSAGSDRMNARVSYAWRPQDSDWMVLERLDYVQESTPDLATQLFTRKLINNVNANWKPRGRGVQVALQYSAKFVRESLQDFTTSGYTDLLGLEARHDLASDLDVGIHAALLRTLATGQRAGQLGLSVGYRIATNTWVGVGYNVSGFWDADFTGANYRAKGLYLNLRTKFDQDTLGLNDRAQPNVIAVQP